MEPNIKLPVPIRTSKNLDKQLDVLLQQTNIPKWRGSIIVETLFYLYLYKKYKHNCLVTTSRWIGIQIFMDKNMSWTIYEKNSEQIVNCIKKGNKNIIIPLYLEYTNGSGHTNLLLYRKDQNVIEHFEPHGAVYSTYNNSTNIMIETKLSIFIDILNTALVKNNLERVTLIKSNVVCPRMMGLQNMESASKMIKNGSGYCAAWSMFFTELALKNPSVSSHDLLQLIFNKLDAMQPTERSDYLRRVIAGYSSVIYDKITKYFEFLLPKNMSMEEYIHHVKNDKDALYNLNINTDVLVDIHLQLMNDPTLTKPKYRELVSNQITTLMRKNSENHYISKITKLKRILRILDTYDALENISPQSVSGTSHTSNHNDKSLPPPGREVGRDKQAVKPCPSGQERNPLTNRCRKIANATRKANPKEPNPCPPGQERNPVTRRCRKIVADANTRKKVKKPGLKPCKEGQIRNPVTNRCKKI